MNVSLNKSSCLKWEKWGQKKTMLKYFSLVLTEFSVRRHRYKGFIVCWEAAGVFQTLILWEDSWIWTCAHTFRIDLLYFKNSGHHEGNFACWAQANSLVMNWAGKDYLPVKIHYYGKIFKDCSHNTIFRTVSTTTLLLIFSFPQQ